MNRVPLRLTDSFVSWYKPAVVVLVLLPLIQALAGTVVSWGNNPGFSAGSVPPGLGEVTSIAAGYSHSLAARPNTTATAWGAGFYFHGQTTVPNGLSNVIALAGGSEHSLALRSDGTAVGWGDNLLGAGVVPAGLISIVAISAGFQHSVALKADGTVRAWGCGVTGCIVPPDATNVVQIAAGGYHTIALNTDGTVAVWDGGGLRQMVPGLSNVIAVTGGGYHNLALKSDGTVVAWGVVFPDRDYGQTSVPPDISNAIGISAGIFHNLVLKSDGTVTAWGDNYYGPCSVPAGLSNVVSIAGGGFHSLAMVDNSPPWTAPFIVRQPAAAPVVRGSRVLLSVGVMSSDPVAYQWRRDGEAIDRATNAVLELAAVTTGDAGRYSVSVYTAQGTNVSTDTPLSVLIPPEIASQSGDLIVPMGGTAGFAVAATGLPSPGYQWRRNGGVIPGSTNSALVLENVQVSQAGNYTVIVSNLGGTITSSNALLTVDSLPIIQVQPANQTAYIGDTVNLSIKALGTAPLRYQWRRQAEDIPGATNATLTLAGLTPNDGAAYSVQVISPFYSITSNVAILTVLDAAPILVTSPQSTTIHPGGSPSLTSVFSGSKPLSYQWHFRGQALPGATRPTLLLTNVSVSDVGPYSIAVTNAVGGLLSPEALVTLVDVALWGGAFGREGVDPMPPVPPSVTNIVGVAQGGSFTVALSANGSVVAWGNNSDGQTNNAPLSNIVAVAAGGSHAMALRNDGKVIAWGNNTYGQSIVPTGLSNVVAMAAGASHSLALRANGTVVGWGRNSSGQTNIPTGLTNVVAIACGVSHSLALTAQGSVVGWGDNAFGKITIPTTLSNVVAIAAGGFHSMAVRSDGTMVAWGLNNYGQTNIPPSLRDVVAVAGGSQHSLALDANGAVTAWGWNEYGQATVAPGLARVTAISGQAAGSVALVGNGPPLRQAAITGLRYSNQGFVVEVPSQSGKVFALEYRDSMLDGEWTALPLRAGTGGMLQLTDTSAPSVQRFYRVRRW